MDFEAVGAWDGCTGSRTASSTTQQTAVTGQFDSPYVPYRIKSRAYGDMRGGPVRLKEKEQLSIALIEFVRFFNLKVVFGSWSLVLGPLALWVSLTGILRILCIIYDIEGTGDVRQVRQLVSSERRVIRLNASPPPTESSSTLATSASPPSRLRLSTITFYRRLRIKAQRSVPRMH